MVVDESREPAIEAEVPGVGLGRRPRLWLSAAIVAIVFLGYSVPFYGLPISLAVPIVLLVARREFWGAAVPRSALLAVLVWIGLWLPAISYFFTGWYWYLTGHEISTGWLLIPLCGPVPYVVGTLVPATAATVVFAAGLTVAWVAHRPWLLVVAAWLTPWAHQLAFDLVVSYGDC
jgi:hypothetical protein